MEEAVNAPMLNRFNLNVAISMWILQDLADSSAIKERSGKRPTTNDEDLTVLNAEGDEDAGAGSSSSPQGSRGQADVRTRSLSPKRRKRASKVTRKRLPAAKGARSGGGNSKPGVAVSQADFKSMSKTLKALDDRLDMLVSNTTRMANSFESLVRDVHTELASTSRNIDGLNRATKDSTKASNDMSKKLSMLETCVKSLTTVVARPDLVPKQHHTRSQPPDTEAEPEPKPRGKQKTAPKAGASAHSKAEVPVGDSHPTSKLNPKKGGGSAPALTPKGRPKQPSPSTSSSDSDVTPSSRSGESQLGSSKSSDSSQSPNCHDRTQDQTKTDSVDPKVGGQGSFNNQALSQLLGGYHLQQLLGGGSSMNHSQPPSVNSLSAHDQSALLRSLLGAAQSSHFQVPTLNQQSALNQSDLMLQLLQQQRGVGGSYTGFSAVPTAPQADVEVSDHDRSHSKKAKKRKNGSDTEEGSKSKHKDKKKR